MTDNRNTRAKLNGTVSLAYQLVLLVCGFVVPRLLIEAFGSEAYGATVSITQFLGFIVLFEGGIGGVARAALYRFLADGDIEGVSAVVTEIRRLFRNVGYVFIAYVLILALSFKYISNIECLDWLSTFFLVVAISISTFGHYFIGLPNVVLLRASQRMYVSDAVSIIVLLLNTLCVIALVQVGCSLIVVKLVSGCILLLRPVLVHLYTKKSFSFVEASGGKDILQQKRNGMAHQIAHYISFNASTIVLTCFAGLGAVAVYAVYNMVVSHMQSLICSCMAGTEALFGDMLAKKENELLNRSFQRSETLISVVAVILLSVTAVLVAPFVKLYTAGIDDVNYLVPTFSQLLVLASLLYCLRVPYHNVIIAAGHFAQTQAASIGEAVVNVVLSILLVGNFGLTGVAVAVLAGTSFRFVYYVIYLSRNILNRNIILFFKRAAVNAAAFVASFSVGSYMISSIEITSYICWAFCGAGILVIALLLVLSINAAVYRDEVLAIFDRASH